MEKGRGSRVLQGEEDSRVLHREGELGELWEDEKIQTASMNTRDTSLDLAVNIWMRKGNAKG